MKTGVVLAAVGAGVAVLIGATAFASAAPAARPRLVPSLGPPPPPPPNNALNEIGGLIVHGAQWLGNALPTWGPGKNVGPTNVIACKGYNGEVGLSVDDLVKGMTYLKALHAGDPTWDSHKVDACAAVKALYNYQTKRFPWQVG